MRRVARLAVTWSAVVVLSPAALGQAPIKSSVTLVSLPVVVLNRAGQLVTTPRPQDFEVLERGRRQTVTSFAEGTPADGWPLHLGLMLDRSLSMEPDLEDTSDAAIKLVDQLDEAGDVTLVEFDTSIRIGRFSPDSYPQLFERIRARTTGYGTALYDALGAYADQARRHPGLHVLVVYTDGADSISRLTLPQLIERLRYGQMLVYAVGYVSHQPGSGRFVQESILKRISHETGGEAFFPGSNRDLERIYAQIAAE